ncbi:MAG: sulfotransferase [Planctomycetes bacterium]|nr:sulfotransferase [Planctomycetota bacterium]
MRKPSPDDPSAHEDIFDPYALRRALAEPHLSPALQEWTTAIRAGSQCPAVFVCGVMVRSGTSLVTNLMALHPDLFRHPRDVWELPILRQIGHLETLSRDFFKAYEQNRERLGEHDLIGLLGTAILAFLQAAVEPGVRILLTHPGAHYIDYFFTMFPHEQLLLLMRDGRDVVESAHKTWPEWKFEQICESWAGNADIMLRCRDRFTGEGRPVFYGRYEDALEEPQEFVRRACPVFGLDPETYPYPYIDTHIPVKGSSSFESVRRGIWERRQRDPNFKPRGRWAKEWTDEQKRVFKRIAGKALIDAGYESDLDW